MAIAKKNKKKKSSRGVVRLTKREEKILTLICRELSPGEISKQLKISDKTFYNHRANIVRKTGARTNIGLYRFALKNKYTKL